MAKRKAPVTPSLLESASRGGDINEGGIAFQAAVVMGHIPRWIAMEGFTSMIREAIFDAEAKFFVPGRGYVKEAIEVKDHSLAPAEFWAEIDRFKQVEAGSPGSYEWFTLASTGLSENLHPLRNSLRRVRDPYGFYRDDPTIFGNSYAEYVQVVRQLGRRDDDAAFLFGRVLLQDDLSLNRVHGKAVFKQELFDHLPEQRDVSDRILEDIYAHLDVFLQSRRNQTITRREVEEHLRERVPAERRQPPQPVRLFTAKDDTAVDTRVIHFAWAPFFGGDARDIPYPEPEIWNEQLVGALRATKAWIVEHRDVRRVRLDGARRLSPAVAIGFVFSAVAGFAVDMVNRGAIWPTDAHETSDTPAYPLTVGGSFESVRGERLIVTVGIFREIVNDVEADLDRLGLAALPTLHIHGAQAIVSPQQLNRIVRDMKGHISQAQRLTGARQIDLFLAGPAPLALFLGHRLNATANIQCYEQVQSGQYVPTCYLS